MNKSALYTAIFSPYDELQPQPELPGADYLCFTDQPLQSVASRRDQLSFNYIAQTTGLPFQTLPINIYNNPFLTIHNHLPVSS